ncbi:MAG: hypothetical protein J6N76_02860, partial [Lachnospiraceae bacterium]|nr:hypothetical protein [Lachnospiraceae bacterium]
MATGTNELKLKLRQEMLDIRNAMSEAECTAASIAICNKLWEAYRRFKYDKTGVFLSYYHMKNEVHLTNMHENLLKNGYELFFPVIEEEEIKFYFAQSPSDFTKGHFGIMEPRERKLPYDESEDAICFVPGVAFSEK